MTEEVTEPVDVTELMQKMDSILEVVGNQQSAIDALTNKEDTFESKFDELSAKLSEPKPDAKAEDDNYDPEGIVTQDQMRERDKMWEQRLAEAKAEVREDPARQNRQAIINASAPGYAKLKGTKPFEDFLKSEKADEFGLTTLEDVEAKILNGDNLTLLEKIAEQYESNKPAAEPVGAKRDYGTAPKIVESREELQDRMEAHMEAGNLTEAADIRDKLETIPI